MKYPYPLSVLGVGIAAIWKVLPSRQARRAQYERFDRQIAVLFRKHPDRPLFDSLPGAGAVLAPRLVAAFGTDRHRFQSAQQAQQLFGIAPVTEQSGKQRWVHWRWACPKFLRQTFHEFAGHSRHWCGWAKPCINGCGAVAKATMRPFVSWLSNGFGSCFIAGKRPPVMTNRAT